MVCLLYVDRQGQSGIGRRVGSSVPGSGTVGRVMAQPQPLLMWVGDRQQPYLTARQARQLPCPAFCPAERHDCYFLNWGYRMAEHHRGEWTIASPVPLMDIRVTTRPSASRVGATVGMDSAGRQRPEVLRQIETRLRSIRREVDDQRRREGAQATRSLIRHRRQRRRQPDVVVHPAACSAETQTEGVNGEGQLVMVGTIGSDDDRSSDGDMMGCSMEQWMEAQRPSDNVLAAHLTVLDELFQDSLDGEHWGRPACKGRSKSLPPTWE